MPRLRKEIVDKIEGLLNAGYINSEIRDKTGVSLPTIRKIRKRLEIEEREKESNKRIKTETTRKEAETVLKTTEKKSEDLPREVSGTPSA